MLKFGSINDDLSNNEIDRGIAGVANVCKLPVSIWLFHKLGFHKSFPRATLKIRNNVIWISNIIQIASKGKISIFFKIYISIFVPNGVMFDVSFLNLFMKPYKNSKRSNRPPSHGQLPYNNKMQNNIY